MKNRKTRSALRRMLFTLALVLVVAAASVGGTIAWLTATTDPVINTFTVGDINIKLYETKRPDGTDKTDTEGNIIPLDSDEWEAKLIPGSQYAKNPRVEVEANSEDCYLFVRFEVSDALATLKQAGKVEYGNLLADEALGWHKLNVTGVDNVWYREVIHSAAVQGWDLLRGTVITDEKYGHGYVYVRDTFTKADIPADSLTLKYTAAAIQMANMDSVTDAWNKLPDAFKNPTSGN